MCVSISFLVTIKFIVAFLTLRIMTSRRRAIFSLDGSRVSSEVSQFEKSELVLFSVSFYSITVLCLICLQLFIYRGSVSRLLSNNQKRCPGDMLLLAIGNVRGR